MCWIMIPAQRAGPDRLEAPLAPRRLLFVNLRTKMTRRRRWLKASRRKSHRVSAAIMVKPLALRQLYRNTIVGSPAYKPFNSINLLVRPLSGIMRLLLLAGLYQEVAPPPKSGCGRGKQVTQQWLQFPRRLSWARVTDLLHGTDIIFVGCVLATTAWGSRTIAFQPVCFPQRLAPIEFSGKPLRCPISCLQTWWNCACS